MPRHEPNCLEHRNAPKWAGTKTSKCHEDVQRILNEHLRELRALNDESPQGVYKGTAEFCFTSAMTGQIPWSGDLGSPDSGDTHPDRARTVLGEPPPR